MHRFLNNFFLRCNSGYLKEIEESKSDPISFQRRGFATLMAGGAETAFGREHGFMRIPCKSGDYNAEITRQIRRFQQNVPVRDYNAIEPYIKRMREGEQNVLWNQKTKWFAKSSGTSSGKSKYIPVTPDSLRITHFGGFKRMLAWYVNSYRETKIFSGKALTLGGSVEADFATMTGDLSAILLQNSPFIAELFRAPCRKSALMSDFSKKIEAICRECSDKNITNFSGVPSWNLMLMNKLLDYNKKSNIVEIWPDIELFMHGGIGFEPYRDLYKTLFPSEGMHYLENYNASEGYFSFQDDLNVDGMLLTVGNGVFYEFAPLERLNDIISGKSLALLTLDEVSAGVDYALVISSVNGLWRYLIGDCIRFVSLYPHRIKVIGRTQLFINAFGEELMISNAEKALSQACKIHNCTVSDFTVAPLFMNDTAGEGSIAGSAERFSKGKHVWVIEFGVRPYDIDSFARDLDNQVINVNSDYEAKRRNNATMEQLQLIAVPKGTFYNWLVVRNKVGGQNKVPRLCGDLHFVKELLADQENLISNGLFNN